MWHSAAASFAILFSAILFAGFDRLSAESVGAADMAAKSADAKPALDNTEKTADGDAVSSSDLYHYKGAIALAEAAVSTANEAAASKGSGGVLSESIQQRKLTQREQTLWQGAIENLSSISAQSPLYGRASAKQREYQKHLADTVRRLAATDRAFLPLVIRDTGLNPKPLHITLCKLDESTSVPLLDASGQLDHTRCHHHQGDERLASAASLIKVPIAIALTTKVSEEDLSLSEPVFVDPGNFTENGGNQPIEVGHEYPLEEVMDQMIQGSDNIGTNQLIDYLGYTHINQSLSKLGYARTTVGHKLIGDKARPANFGNGVNQTNTNDITAMMAQLYSAPRPGDDAILTALSNQQDTELGHDALKDMGSDVELIGEKTGQNNLVLGSTLAMEIGGDRYVLTAAIAHDGNVDALRRLITGIAVYLSENGFSPASRG